MDRQTIEMLVQFLSRVELKGSEVPAFNQVMSAIQKMLQDQQKPPEPQNDVKADSNS